MGYTHYWTPKTVGATKWRKFSTAAAKAAELSGVELAYEYDEPRTPPIFGDTMVRFNGVGYDGHETFMLTRENDEWHFCKTARKPYDVVVVACLVLAHHMLGYEVRSDGLEAEWQDGLALASRAVGYELGMPHRGD